MTGEEGPGEDEPGIRIGFKSLEQFPAQDTGREPSQGQTTTWAEASGDQQQ